MMIGEILSTGDEICMGSIVDSNAAHIAVSLQEAGITVSRHNCVGDDMDDLVSILKEIGGRADILVVTGGLGPTTDDLTAEAVARATEYEIVLNQPCVSYIEQFFAKFSRKMAKSDYKQAMLPKTAVPIFNLAGTAPGFILQIGRCRCYFLPGVPKEMEKMLAESVIPDIIKLHQDHAIFLTTNQMSVFGLPEAIVNDRLTGFSTKFPNVKLGMLARFPTITVKLTAVGKDKGALNDDLAQAGNWAYEKLKDKVFSSDGKSMEAEVGALLRTNKATIAVAESCTGGLIAHLLTNVAGSSDYFLFSGVTYSNQAKIRVLGVPEDTIETYGAVHEETVKAMADGARKVSGATIGLATSGIAGPTGGTEEKPVGTVCIGISTGTEVISYSFYSHFKDRLSNKQIFAICALDMLRKILMAS
ncbi:MAG: CinA family nicotinamide mononucleotide deamidase-related protein [Dissulfuribacterales bacterium]